MAHKFLNIEPFVPGDNPAESWADWRCSYELFETAVKYNKEDDETRIALLLSVIGKPSYKDYKTFIFADLAQGQTRTVKDVLDKFDEHYRPYKNITLSTFVFNNIVQKPGQNFDAFVTELKLQADQCDFKTSYERNVKDRIIQGMRDDVLRERLLREPQLTLAKAMEIGKSAELSRMHSLAMTHPTSSQVKVDAIHHSKQKTPKHQNVNKQQQNVSKHQTRDQKRPCSRCGSFHQPKHCPAYGKTCNNCEMLNHFSKVCRQPKNQQKQTPNKLSHQVSSLHIQTEPNVAFIGSLSANNDSDWVQQVYVNNFPVLFKLDTGAQVNVLPSYLLQQLDHNLTPRPTTTTVCTYTGDAIPVLGTCELQCTVNNKNHLLQFIIVDLDVQPVLSASSCIQMNLIQRTGLSSINDQYSVNIVNSDLPQLQQIINDYSDVFQGVGRLPGVHKIILKENATPVIAASRKIPLALEQKVQDELLQMEQNGIIEKVTKPTDWVNPVVIVPKKDNSIRICLDPRHLNKFIKRQHYQIPSQDQLMSKLQGSTIFSLIDAKSAFYHIQLDDESADLCTFITPFGRYRFLVMPFGLSCAPEIFQMSMDSLFENQTEINPYFDDIIIHSKTIEDHCVKLKTVLEIARQNNLKLNQDKIQLAVPKLQYLGHIVTSEGLSPDPKKVQAITDFLVPQNKQDLMRFLGMATYLMKFVPQFSQETTVLRNLLKKDSNWIWDATTEKAFVRVKQLLQSTPVLQFFDRDKPVKLSVDASSFGLGGVLLQNNKPVAYTSATLTDAQTRYSQIEKELLAVVHACEHFHYYVYGMDIVIETDHKPLLGLIHKPFEMITPRLQRLLLRLQRYSFELTHVPGKQLAVADALSRAPLPANPVITTEIDNVQLMVSVVVQASSSKLDEIKLATQNDPELKAVKHYIMNGWPQARHCVDVEARPYWTLQDELHLQDGLICRGQRLVIPKSCRKDILQRLHTGHRGIVSCKNLARQSLFWPGLSTEVENMVSNCTICQLNQKQNIQEPLLDRDLAQRPWQKVAIDFFHLSSVTYILIIDYFSKYIELQHLHSTNAFSVINTLKTCFARFGIPEEIVCDNGPPFDSTEFSQFCTNWDIFLNPSSPGFPRSNGQVERSVQTIKSSLTKAAQGGNDQHLVLMEYRNTPMDGMPSPAEVLMGRRLRTLIPTLPTQLEPKYDCSAVKQSLQKRQQRQHKYDIHSCPLQPLQQRQPVLFRLKDRWQKGTVVIVGPQPRSYLIEAENGRQYRRNRFHIKPFKSTPAATRTTTEDLFQYSEYNSPESSGVVHQGSPTSIPQATSSHTPPSNNVVTRCGRTVRKPLKLMD